MVFARAGYRIVVVGALLKSTPGLAFPAPAAPTFLLSSLIPLNNLTLSPTLTTPNSLNSSCPRSKITAPVISFSLNAAAWCPHLYCARKAEISG